MTYHFKKAIIRKPCKNIIYGLSSKKIQPNYNKLLSEHDFYTKTLKNLNLEIIKLKELENFPDSVFVEDPALIYKSTCIILNPKDNSRNLESFIIKNEIKKYFNDLLYIENGFVEGGDVLNINNHFIIGISTRTNTVGAKSLKTLLEKMGASVKICETPKNILHFKSECSILNDDTILVSKKMSEIEYLKSNFKLIELPEGEEGAANSLRINDKLLIPDGYKKAEEILSKKYNIIKIKTDEIKKVDAGLSCMSLRW